MGEVTHLFARFIYSIVYLHFYLYQRAALLVGRSLDRYPIVSLGILSETSDKSMCPGSTQPFEISTRIFLGVKTAGADNLTTLMCRLSRNPVALTPRTPEGHLGLFRGYFTFTNGFFIVARIVVLYDKHNAFILSGRSYCYLKRRNDKI
jgi:hypothetical protein